MKTQTYDFREFMKKEHIPEKKSPAISLIPAAVTPLVPVPVFAESVKAQIMNAFEPLIDLLMAFAYPGALAVMLGGALMIIFGQSERGMSLIQRAGIGYVVLMLLPMIFEILANAVAKAV